MIWLSQVFWEDKKLGYVGDTTGLYGRYKQRARIL